MDDAPRLCPRCRDEFRSFVERCPDCDVELVVGPLEEDGGAADRLPPSNELECAGLGEPWEVRRLAEAFQARGLSCRVDPYPPSGEPGRGSRAGSVGRGNALGVYVRARDLERARLVEQELMADLLTHTHEAGADVSLACPGCASPLDPEASDCNECGLHFPEVDE